MSSDNRHEPTTASSQYFGTYKHCGLKIFRSDPDYSWYHDNGDIGSASYLCAGESD